MMLEPDITPINLDTPYKQYIMSTAFTACFKRSKLYFLPGEQRAQVLFSERSSKEFSN